MIFAFLHLVKVITRFTPINSVASRYFVFWLIAACSVSVLKFFLFAQPFHGKAQSHLGQLFRQVVRKWMMSRSMCYAIDELEDCVFIVPGAP